MKYSTIQRPVFAAYMLTISVLTHGAETAKQTLEKLPIVYSNNYNISFFGFEKLHPFDSQKYGHVADYLSKQFNVPIDDLSHKPVKPADDTVLKQFHTESYLQSLKTSSVVARITEILPLAWLPNWIVQWRVLNPMRSATAGTILASKLAWDKQYAINLGGGFHHADRNKGEGFCVFGDIQLAMLNVWKKKQDAKILYIDLDAHQGNGVELGLESYMKEKDPSKPRLVVFDMYGANNYPSDPNSQSVRSSIQYNRPITIYKRSSDKDKKITDDGYLNMVRELEAVIPNENPDFIFYNAGTDVYVNDPLGGMGITKEGIKQRDEMVFQYAQKNRIPLVMTLSGGYTKESAGIIGESITNVLKKLYGVKPSTAPQKSSWFNIFSWLWLKKNKN